MIGVKHLCLLGVGNHIIIDAAVKGLCRLSWIPVEG